MYLSNLQGTNRYEVSRTTAWRWSSEGRLPKPIRLIPGYTRWHLEMPEDFEANIENVN
ncbi:AlpA family transcriptional regulator [Vreelandella rituensis]|uniref:AlpA family transcriptional regulator n=1 Tax=Vreelandella rituensis TaxID=2282306 RepID=A0A368TQ87_9GAMM|nr:AlpA family transcriptional regulator [Halomonas rituensis]